MESKNDIEQSLDFDKLFEKHEIVQNAIKSLNTDVYDNIISYITAVDPNWGNRLLGLIEHQILQDIKEEPELERLFDKKYFTEQMEKINIQKQIKYMQYQTEFLGRSVISIIVKNSFIKNAYYLCKTIFRHNLDYHNSEEVNSLIHICCRIGKETSSIPNYINIIPIEEEKIKKYSETFDNIIDFCKLYYGNYETDNLYARISKFGERTDSGFTVTIGITFETYNEDDMSMNEIIKFEFEHECCYKRDLNIICMNRFQKEIFRTDSNELEQDFAEEKMYKDFYYG